MEVRVFVVINFLLLGKIYSATLLLQLLFAYIFLTHKIMFIQTERSFICNDTGALLQAPQERFQLYNEYVHMFIQCHVIIYF